MEGGDTYAHLWQADGLLLHEGMGGLRYRERPAARRQGDIHAAWTT